MPLASATLGNIDIELVPLSDVTGVGLDVAGVQLASIPTRSIKERLMS